MQVKTFLPRCAPMAWLRPTVVVVFPSPSGVGVIAVTTMYFPFGASFRRSRAARRTFALYRPWGSISSARRPAFAASSPMGSGDAACAISMSRGTGAEDPPGPTSVLAIAELQHREARPLVCWPQPLLRNRRRASRRAGAYDRLRKICVAGARRRTTLGDERLHVGVGCPGAACGRERELTCDVRRCRDRLFRLGEVPDACRVVHPKYFPLRLIHEDVDCLRHHTDDGAHRVADGGMLRNHQLRSETARHFGIKRRGGSADGHQGARQAGLRIEEPRDGPALHGAIDEDAERPPAAVVRLDSRILRQRALQHHSRRLADHELMDALGQRFGAVLALARRYVALLGGEDGGAEPARLTAPPLVTAE